MFAFRRTAWTRDSAAWAARHEADAENAQRVAPDGLRPHAGAHRLDAGHAAPWLFPTAPCALGPAPTSAPTAPSWRPPLATSVLTTLQMQQQLMSRLLQVHPLSPAIEYDANRPLRVNATNWWHELCHQSATGVIRRESRKRRLSSEEAMDLRWWEPSAQPHSSPSIRAMQSLISSQKKVFLRDVFQRLLKSLTGTTARRHDPTHPQEVITAVDQGVGSVGAMLLRQWRDETSQGTDTETTQRSPLRRDYDAPRFANEIICFLIQFYEALGSFHALHEHKLLPCSVQRTFVDKEAWMCSSCGGSWSTKPDYENPAVVFRCHACDFSLCPDCLSCTPSNLNNLQDVRRQQEAFQQRLNVGRFFSVVLPQLHETLEDFRSIAPVLAVALRTRLRDLPVYRVQEMVPMATLLVSMLECSRFPRALIDSPDFRWLPLYMSGGRVRMQSFLAPLMWWTSSSDESQEAELYDGKQRSPEEIVKMMGWNSGYRLLKKLPTRMLKALLNREQDPYVIDATLCWIGTCITTMMARRNGATGVGDNADGLLINLSLALVEAVLPTLENQPHVISTDYHEGLLPRRVYPDKEVPLRSHRKMHESERIRKEDERVHMRDMQMLQHRRHHDEAPNCYYPTADRHFGVECNHCGAQDITTIRYKCVFCDEVDICSDCFDKFSSHTINFACMGQPQGMMVHAKEHVFLRVDVPVPLISVQHFVPPVFDGSRLCDGDTSGAFDLSRLYCCECHQSLQHADVIFKCANCYDPRLVCRACLEQEERFHDPSRMHAPGHLYVALHHEWCRTFNIFAEDLHFRSLFYPAPLYPRERFNTETELLYMAIKCIHIGPLFTLAQYISDLREANELRAYCTCEEERVKIEQQACDMVGGVGALIRKPTLSNQYAANKARIKELESTKALSDMHLVDAANVMMWIQFYGKVSSWLLHLASPTQDARAELVDDFSSVFSAFPEHFFVDLCDMMYLLSLDCVDSEQARIAMCDEEAVVVVEPLLSLFVQLLASSQCTKNPHLRVHAAKGLSALLGFFTKCRGNNVIRAVFERSKLLCQCTVRAVLQFHKDMEAYHKSNSGPPFATEVVSGDPTLWGFISIRMTTSLLLRYLWQIPSQRSQVMHSFQGRHEVDDELVKANQARLLLIGLWNDASKLMEEGNAIVTVLRQLAEQQDAMWHGQAVSLPHRPGMMEEYISQHSKHLRLTFRMLVEVVDMLTWTASQSSLRCVVLKPEMVEQAARTSCFLLSTIASALHSGSWAFSRPLELDGRALLAHLELLLVRCAGLGDQCSIACMWKLTRLDGDVMKRHLGDLDTHARESMMQAILHLEAARHSGTGASNGSEAGEDVGATRLSSLSMEDITDDELNTFAPRTYKTGKGKTAALYTEMVFTPQQLGKCFVAKLASDGRFDYEKFVQCSNAVRGYTVDASNPASTIDLLDDDWIRKYVETMQQCRDMLALQASLDELIQDMPEQYHDPILNTVMVDPVRLPSGNTVDRSIIEKHLLSAQVDPFTRCPLKPNQLVPCDALRLEIQQYLQSKLQHLPHSKDDIAATWGIAFANLMEEQSVASPQDAPMDEQPQAIIF